MLPTQPFSFVFCMFCIPNKRLNFSSIVNSFILSLAFLWASSHVKKFNFFSLSSFLRRTIIKAIIAPTPTAQLIIEIIRHFLFGFLFD